jgi:hypothetical protein
MGGNFILSANLPYLVRFEVFTAMSMKKVVFWDLAPCSYGYNRRFGGMYRCSHLLTVFSSRFTCPEDGRDTFLRNVVSNHNCAAADPRRRLYSLPYLITRLLKEACKSFSRTCCRPCEIRSFLCSFVLEFVHSFCSFAL